MMIQPGKQSGQLNELVNLRYVDDIAEVALHKRVSEWGQN